MKDYTYGPRPGFLPLWLSQGGHLTVLLVLGLLVLTALSYAQLRDGHAFETRGVEVIGQVSDRRDVVVRRDGETETDYYVTIQYEAAGTEVEVERKVSASFHRQSHSGRNHRVRYLPEDPKQVEFTIGETWAGGQMLRWLSLFVGLAALGTFWWTAAPIAEALRARRYGAVQHAKVLRIERRQKGRHPKFVLVFSTQDRVVGESLPSFGAARYAAYPSGAEIEVYRGLNRRLWWVGDVGPSTLASNVPPVSKR